MNDTADTIAIIRRELKRRSGKPWSVTGARGSAYGWLKITSPPKRQERGYLTDADRAELADLLGLDRVSWQGVSIPASNAHYTEYVDRARGLTPTKIAQPYWD